MFEKNLKAIIFDLDGTLYESRHFPLRLILSDPLHICMLAAERRCRKQLCDRHFDKASDYYDALFSLMGKGSAERAERCRRWFYGTYMPLQVRIIRDKFGPRPQLREFISDLRARGLKIAVLSDYCFTAEKLAAIGLSEADFDAVWESPALGGLKPREEVFLNACKALGISPSETLMIGDKATKDGGALRAGLRFIHLVNSDRKHPKSPAAPNAETDPARTRTPETKTESAPVEMAWNELLLNFAKKPISLPSDASEGRRGHPEWSAGWS